MGFSYDPLQVRYILLGISLPLLIAATSRLSTHAGDDFKRDRDIQREKRREARAKRNSIFDLEDGKGGFTPNNAQLLDLSFWGASITTALPLKVGQNVRGRIHSAEGGVVQIAGRVKWSRVRHGAPLYGIGFDQSIRVTPNGPTPGIPAL